MSIHPSQCLLHSKASTFVFAQQSLQPKCHVGTMLVFHMLCRITVFKSTQNWVSVSDGSRTDKGHEFQSVGPSHYLSHGVLGYCHTTYNIVTFGFLRHTNTLYLLTSLLIVKSVRVKGKGQMSPNTNHF